MSSLDGTGHGETTGAGSTRGRSAVARAARAAQEAQRLRQVLKGSELFAGLEHEAFDQVVTQFREVVLPAGAILVRQGERSTTAYIVTSGRLRASIAVSADSASGRGASGGAATRERIVGEVLPGEVVGEMSLVADDPRAATIRAARDSMLVAVEREQFEALVKTHPGAMQAVLKTVVRRLRHALHGNARSSSPVHALAILPAGTGTDLSAFTDELARAFSELGPTTVLTRERMVADLGLPENATIDADDAQLRALRRQWQNDRGGPLELGEPSRTEISEAEVSQWLHTVEADHRYVLYQADSAPTSWTMRCLRQADRLLLVGHAERSRHPGDVERVIDRFEQLGSHAGVEIDKHLVLLQPASREHPSGTSAWLRDRNVTRHHHVRSGESGDFRRLARRLAGRSVLLTLGGGGARGLAHVGVLRALAACDVEYDALAGTSAGALVGAAPAFGWSADEVYERISQRLVAGQSPIDYTVPVTALARGERIAQRIRATYGDCDVEDTWLPFLCVSCNITRGSQVVHRHGSLRRAIRASISIPGVLPPVRTRGGDVLVDGGLVNNLPVELQQEDWPGSDVLAVSLRGEVTISADDLPENGVLSGWPSVRARFNPLRRQRRRVPSMAEVILRSTDTSSTLSTRASEARASLLLNPPVSGFALLDFARMDELVEVGYRHAMSRLPAWLETRGNA